MRVAVDGFLSVAATECGVAFGFPVRSCGLDRILRGERKGDGVRMEALFVDGAVSFDFFLFVPRSWRVGFVGMLRLRLRLKWMEILNEWRIRKTRVTFGHVPEAALGQSSIEESGDIVDSISLSFRCGYFRKADW